MKKLITLILVLISVQAFSQNWYLIENDSIVSIGIPNSFIRNDSTHVAFGYRNMGDSIWFVDGFRRDSIPEYNDSLQYLGPRYYNVLMEYVTYPVINKTQQQLEQELNRRLEFNSRVSKDIATEYVLKDFVKTKLDSGNFTARDYEYYLLLYDNFIGDGRTYEEGTIVKYNEKLYKVISEHESQWTWTPDAAVSLFDIYHVPGLILEWVPPQGTVGLYHLGDMVTHNGQTWVSDYDNNSWEPGVFGWSNP